MDKGNGAIGSAGLRLEAKKNILKLIAETHDPVAIKELCGALGDLTRSEYDEVRILSDLSYLEQSRTNPLGVVGVQTTCTSPF